LKKSFCYKPLTKPNNYKLNYIIAKFELEAKNGSENQTKIKTVL